MIAQLIAAIHDPRRTSDDRGRLTLVGIELADASGPFTKICFDALQAQFLTSSHGIYTLDRLFRPTNQGSDHLDSCGHLLSLLEHLSPRDAGAILSISLKGEWSTYEKADLALILAAVAKQMKPDDAATICADAAHTLADVIARESNEFAKDDPAHALAAVAERMTPSDADAAYTNAAGILARAVKSDMEASWKADRARYLASVAERMRPSDAEAICADVARFIAGAIESNADASDKSKLAHALGAVARGMRPSDAEAICADAARVLGEALKREASASRKVALAGGLAAIAERTRPDVAATACADAARIVVSAIASEASVYQNAELFRALAGLTARMRPDDAESVCTNAAHTLADAITREAIPYAKAYLARTSVAITVRMRPDDATGVVRSLADAIGREADADLKMQLAAVLPSLASSMPPNAMERCCREILLNLARKRRSEPAIHESANTNDINGVASYFLRLLDEDDARVIARGAAVEICTDRFLNGKEEDFIEESHLPGRLDSLLRDDSRRERAYRDAMFDLAWSTGGPIAAEMVLAEPYPCRLTDQELVELLKMPTCFGPARMVVLKHLGNRHGRAFKHHWEFVRLARENGLKLDLTTPPKRLDPKESLRRMIEALERPR